MSHCKVVLRLKKHSGQEVVVHQVLATASAAKEHTAPGLLLSQQVLRRKHCCPLTLNGYHLLPSNVLVEF